MRMGKERKVKCLEEMKRCTWGGWRFKMKMNASRLFGNEGQRE